MKLIPLPIRIVIHSRDGDQTVECVNCSRFQSHLRQLLFFVHLTFEYGYFNAFDVFFSVTTQNAHFHLDDTVASGNSISDCLAKDFNVLAFGSLSRTTAQWQLLNHFCQSAITNSDPFLVVFCVNSIRLLSNHSLGMRVSISVLVKTTNILSLSVAVATSVAMR